MFLRLYPAASHEIIDIHGNERYRRKLGHGADTIVSVGGAAQADRVAFAYGALRSFPLGNWHGSDHIVVLDVGAKREVEIPNPPDKGIEKGQAQFFIPPSLALSPDGRHLAVCKGASLALWDVP